MSHTVQRDASSASSASAAVSAAASELADGEEAHLGMPSPGAVTSRGVEAVADLVVADLAGRALRLADERQGRRELERVVEHHLQLLVTTTARTPSCPAPS